MRIEREPLELAAELARAGVPGGCMAYERDAERGVALGARIEIVAGSAGVRCIDAAGETRHFGSADVMGSVESALATIPQSGWRAYGTLAFELAHLLYGMDTAEHHDPLLELCIPRVEVRLRHGVAIVRAFVASELEEAMDLVRRLDRRAPEPASPASVTPLSESYLERTGAEAYRTLVSAATREIGLGTLQKVIASRVVPIPTPVDVVATYVAGRRWNTPARSVLIDRGDVKMAGFSPETVLEVSAGGRVSTQPLAGTRALVSDEEENARLRAELLRDTKELAEHAMSVRLAFEELGRVCEPGSIGIVDFMSVCRRSTVQHLASRLTGTLAAGKSGWRALEVLFPAVTASGIPKREALAWIRSNEAEPRGLYAGAAMIVDDDGTMDVALILRSIFQRGKRAWLRAGAGIVDRSTPERELRETCEKLASVARHVVPLAAAAGETHQWAPSP